MQHRFCRVLCAATALALAVVAPAGAQAPPDLAALKAQYKRPPPRPIDNPALVALGRELFHDPALSASGKTACGSCHFPDQAWSDREMRSRNDSGKLTSRRSQTLIGIGHMVAPVGWDGRNKTLEAQAKASIATGSMSMRETETPVKVEVIEARIRDNPAYAQKFAAALPRRAVDMDSIAVALAAFERAIEPGIAPFDRYVAGDDGAISDAGKRGLVLFNGKGNCDACHGGWRFTDDAFHDIGTSRDDRGRGRDLKDDEAAQFAFKTPTLRSVAERPPFMHNGAFPTLDAVVRHYETGGIARPSRSTFMRALTLSDGERADLVAFIETLSAPDATAPATR